MQLKNLALLLGLVSILIAQLDITLRDWLNEHKSNPPAYPTFGILSRIVNLQHQLKAYLKTSRHVFHAILFLRLSSVIVAIISQLILMGGE